MTAAASWWVREDIAEFEWLFLTLLAAATGVAVAVVLVAFAVAGTWRQRRARGIYEWTIDTAGVNVENSVYLQRFKWTGLTAAKRHGYGWRFQFNTAPLIIAASDLTPEEDALLRSWVDQVLSGKQDSVSAPVVAAE